MTRDEFKDKMFQKLVGLKEFSADDRQAYDKDFDEFTPTWDVFLEIINEAVEDSQPKTYSEMIKRSYKNKNKK